MSSRHIPLAPRTAYPVGRGTFNVDQSIRPLSWVQSHWTAMSPQFRVSTFQNQSPYQDCFPIQIAQHEFLPVSSFSGWHVDTRLSHDRGKGSSEVFSFSASCHWIQTEWSSSLKRGFVLTTALAVVSTLSRLCLASWHGVATVPLTQPCVRSY